MVLRAVGAIALALSLSSSLSSSALAGHRPGVVQRRIDEIDDRRDLARLRELAGDLALLRPQHIEQAAKQQQQGAEADEADGEEPPEETQPGDHAETASVST